MFGVEMFSIFGHTYTNKYHHKLLQNENSKRKCRLNKE